MRFVFRPTTGFGEDVPPRGEVNALGWEVYLRGLTRLRERLGSFGKPVIITLRPVDGHDRPTRPPAPWP
ncbi:MAG: hypothetical protein AB1331_06015 [Bacillota bacterium]